MRSRLVSLQALRAFAALAVVLFHTGFTFGSLARVGSFGVDIFFIISGFIMAMICRSEAAFFFRKRLVRIVPLYWTLTLLTFAGLALRPSLDAALGRSPLLLLKSLFFIPYLRPDGSVYPILVIGWTLNYEICFYLLLTAALALAPRYATLLTAFLLLAFVSLMRLLPPTPVPYFFSRPLMLEFVAGLAAFHIYTAVSVPTCVRLRPLFYLLIPAAIAAMVLVQGYRLENIPHLIALGVPAFLLTQSVVLLARSGQDAPWRLPILLGDASYSLYLTHVFVISAFKRLVATHIPALRPDHLPGALAILLASSLVALLVHVAADRPIHRFLSRHLTRRTPASTSAG